MWVADSRGDNGKVTTSSSDSSDDRGGIFITRDDRIYVTDSESGPDTGADELPGLKKGIRIGSARDGRVTAFIEDMESTRADHSGAEGVGVDAAGNVYGAVARRQMLGASHQGALKYGFAVHAWSSMHDFAVHDVVEPLEMRDVERSNRRNRA